MERNENLYVDLLSLERNLDLSVTVLKTMLKEAKESEEYKGIVDKIFGVEKVKSKLNIISDTLADVIKAKNELNETEGESR